MVFIFVQVMGENRLEMIPCGVAVPGDFYGGGKSFRAVRKMFGHLPGGFQPLPGPCRFLGRKGAQGPVQVYGPHQTVQRITIFMREMDGI